MTRGFPVGDGTFTSHRQVTVTEGDVSADVDEKLAPLMAQIWRAGWATSRSCQHHGPSGKVWIEFLNTDDAAAFLSVVAANGGDLPERMEWCFASFRRHSEPLLNDLKNSRLTGAWELHTQVYEREDAGYFIAVSVLFPRRDLKVALEALRTYNSIT